MSSLEADPTPPTAKGSKIRRRANKLRRQLKIGQDRNSWRSALLVVLLCSLFYFLASSPLLSLQSVAPEELEEQNATWTRVASRNLLVWEALERQDGWLNLWVRLTTNQTEELEFYRAVRAQLPHAPDDLNGALIIAELETKLLRPLTTRSYLTNIDSRATIDRANLSWGARLHLQRLRPDAAEAVAIEKATRLMKRRLLLFYSFELLTFLGALALSITLLWDFFKRGNPTSETRLRKGQRYFSQLSPAFVSYTLLLSLMLVGMLSTMLTFAMTSDFWWHRSVWLISSLLVAFLGFGASALIAVREVFGRLRAGLTALGIWEKANLGWWGFAASFGFVLQRCWSLLHPNIWLNLENAIYLSFGDPLVMWFDATTAVVFAPIFEEIVFRGLLFGTLRTKLSFLPSALASNVAFALIHYQYASYGLVSVFIFGLLACLVTERTGSIKTAILFHAFVNFSITFSSLLVYDLNL